MCATLCDLPLQHAAWLAFELSSHWDIAPAGATVQQVHSSCLESGILLANMGQHLIKDEERPRELYLAFQGLLTYRACCVPALR
jgi:hypothetical protein